MNSKTIVGAIILAQVLLAGCGNSSGGSAYVPKPTTVTEAVAAREGLDQNYIPMEEGKQWTYVTEIESASRNGGKTIPSTEINYKITKVESKSDSKTINWEVTVNNKVTDRQIWLLNNEGIYQVAIGPKLNPFTTPQPIIRFPVKNGDSFNWKGSGLLASGLLGSNEVISKVLGTQEVDTDLGRMKGVAIESTMKFATSTGSGSGVSTIWITPGVGIVRFVQALTDGKIATRQMLRLKSHS